MPRLLNGKDLADYIKQRQMREVRSLQLPAGVRPKLAIVASGNNPVNAVYMRKKQRYGADIAADVDIHEVAQADLKTVLRKLNTDNTVHGIIVQLPLDDTTQTEAIINLVAPHKDVDGLGAKAEFEPATPMAIMWLLAGYNVVLKGKHILLIGRGKLVGAPLEKILKESGLDVEVVGREVKDLKTLTLKADVIITATGSPAVLSADMIKLDTVVVDAGVASEGGKTIGDVAPDVYERDDLTLTPLKGGVGPLTVCALFENVIRAAQNSLSQDA